jgi:hypothetical protein
VVCGFVDFFSTMELLSIIEKKEKLSLDGPTDALTNKRTDGKLIYKSGWSYTEMQGVAGVAGIPGPCMQLA